MPLSEETSRTAEELLRPYLDAALTLSKPAVESDGQLPVQLLFELFYIQRTSAKPMSSASVDIPAASVIIVPDGPPKLAELADDATTQAENIFWKAVESLKAAGCRPRRQSPDGEEAQDESVIDSFWPPLDAVDDPSDDW